ncbi:MAG: tetratricopeptide repeat protein [Thalassobaculaceae bacterium]
MNEEFSKATIDELLQRALQYHNAFKVNQAIGFYEKILKISPKNPHAIHYLGVAYHQLDQHNLALKFLEMAVSLKSESSETFNHYGSALLKVENFEAAEAAFRQALKLYPSNAEALFNLGNLIISGPELQNQVDTIAPERAVEATHLLRQAIALNPDHLTWQLELANALIEIEEKLEAKQIIDDIIFKEPTLAKAYFIRAKIKFGDMDLTKCILLSPTSHRAINNLGVVKLRQGDLNEVVPLYKKASLIAPDDPSVRWGLANGLLATGNLKKGWREARWRHKKPELLIERQGLPREWRGEEIKDGKLLVYHEQGIGDELRFASCFKDLIHKSSAPCIIETDSRLIPLFSRSFPEIEFINKLPRSENAIPEVDYSHFVKTNNIEAYTALGDLPLHLRPNVESFSKEISYLIPSPKFSDAWKEQLDRMAPGKKIGFCWNTALPNKRYGDYFFSINELNPIFSIKNSVLVNLQATDCEEELKLAEEHFGIEIYRPKSIDMFNELDNVAALISQLDFVVGPFTSILSMAGAIGTRCFGLTLTKDWTALGTDDFPWNPTMTCFYKGRSNSWKPLMEKVADMIVESE